MLSPLGLESLGFESRPHSGRLSGLLSGCPPTGTRPQARAKLGNRELSALNYCCKSFFAFGAFFFGLTTRNGYARVVVEPVERAARRAAKSAASAPSAPVANTDGYPSAPTTVPVIGPAKPKPTSKKAT